MALNVPILKNEAYIGHNANIHAGGLVIEALMTDVKRRQRHQNFGAEAVSGASGKAVGIAGSLAVSVLDARSTAVIEGGSTVTLNDSVKGFDPSAKVDVAGNTIDLGVGHGLKTGAAVAYKNGGGTDIDGLKRGTTYYVIADDSGKIKLATTAENAGKGTAIDLKDTGAGD